MQIERDPVSGYLTTGHEWNGIKELNTPVPRIVWFFIAVTHIWALGYWLLMPAFPLGSTYTKGLLNADDRAAVTESVRQAQAARSGWTDELMSKSYAEIQRDQALMAEVRRSGRALFGDNCVACHGENGQGAPGFPDLRRSSLWGATPEVIAETIRVGINSGHKDSRVSQMPAFGRDQMLQGSQIQEVLAYVLSLSGPAGPRPAEMVEAGKAVFAANCASCHGDDAKGKLDVGAPNLTTGYWRTGGSGASLHGVLWDGLRGQMPSWEGRLSPVDRKILTLYVVDLRERHQ
ncbi:MAG: cytochrome-c oxidase, cbb3-type subunit III [Enhydrobacter sp.]|nr:cytochrome-c oxidase, cbb3-type subunit III [Enhydrobacter sp.]